MSLFKRKLANPYVSEAQSGDIPHIATLHADAFPKGWSKNELQKMLSAVGTFCLILRAEGKINDLPIGFVICRDAGGEAEIISIATEGKHRHRGVATHLMEAAVRRLQSDRVPLLFLEVDEKNDHAIQLYRQLGFVQAGTRKGYYHDENNEETDQPANTSNALVMRLELS